MEWLKDLLKNVWTGIGNIKNKNGKKLITLFFISTFWSWCIMWDGKTLYDRDNNGNNNDYVERFKDDEYYQENTPERMLEKDTIENKDWSLTIIKTKKK